MGKIFIAPHCYHIQPEGFFKQFNLDRRALCGSGKERCSECRQLHTTAGTRQYRGDWKAWGHSSSTLKEKIVPSPHLLLHPEPPQPGTVMGMQNHSKHRWPPTEITAGAAKEVTATSPFSTTSNDASKLLPHFVFFLKMKESLGTEKLQHINLVERKIFCVRPSLLENDDFQQKEVKLFTLKCKTIPNKHLYNVFHFSAQLITDNSQRKSL